MFNYYRLISSVWSLEMTAFLIPWHMNIATRKPVFGLSDQMRLKPACAATEARQRLEISYVETRGIILSRPRIAKALNRLRGCTGWSVPLLFAYGKAGFLITGLNYYVVIQIGQFHRLLGNLWISSKKLQRWSSYIMQDMVSPKIWTCIFNLFLSPKIWTCIFNLFYSSWLLNSRHICTRDTDTCCKYKNLMTAWCFKTLVS